MGVEELKTKIIKLAQAYRTERIRNEDFEKTLKSANQDIAQAKKIQAELENLQSSHQDKAKKLLDMQKEVKRVNLYKDTIRKQEKVIAKFEVLMEKTLKDTKKAREGSLELEKLKTENFELQKILKEASFGPKGENSEVERYRREIMQLENLVADLREELRSKRPQSSSGRDWEDEKIEIEVTLQKAQARVDAMQNEMTQNAGSFAKEISKLKMIIAEKQSIIDTMTM